MFRRVLWKSILERKARTFVAVLAVTVAATTVSAVLHLQGDVQRRMAHEVRAYGPNLTVYPRGETHPLVVGGIELGGTSSARSLSEEAIAAAETCLPTGAPRVRVRSGEVVAKGVPCGAISVPWKEAIALCPWWATEGTPDERGEACLVGVDLAKRLFLSRGQEVEVNGRKLRVEGLLATGGVEDRQMVLSPARADLLGEGYAALWARVEGSASDVETVASAIERRVPSAAARPVRQVSESEGKVLARVRGLLLYICLAVLAASGLCVATTMLASASDREREMALLLALGAGPRRIATLTLSHAAVLGAIGGGVGYVLGWVAARILGTEIFHAPAEIAWGVLAPVLGASVALCLFGALAPLRRALTLSPAIVLKGE